VAIQFESSLELSAIYLMEQDDAVLEFYDQPHTFKLKYLDKAGKKFRGLFFQNVTLLTHLTQMNVNGEDRSTLRSHIRTMRVSA